MFFASGVVIDLEIEQDEKSEGAVIYFWKYFQLVGDIGWDSWIGGSEVEGYQENNEMFVDISWGCAV